MFFRLLSLAQVLELYILIHVKDCKFEWDVVADIYNARTPGLGAGRTICMLEMMKNLCQSTGEGDNGSNCRAVLLLGT